MDRVRAARRCHCWPTLALRPYIDRYWGWEHPDQLPLPRLMPGLGAELFFHHGSPPRVARGTAEQQLERGHLLCVRRASVQLVATSAIGFTAVRIRAGALGRFTRIPLRELNDSQLGAADLWGRPGTELVERVAEAATSAERVDLIEQFLLQRLADGSGDPVAERALQHMYRHPHASAITRVAEGCGLSPRQLERRVSAYFGQAPVEVRRTARFYHAVRRLALEPETSTLESALEVGYYDQSHFIREFRRFSGVTPQTFRRASAGLSHFYNSSSGPRL